MTQDMTHPRECDPALALCPCRAGRELVQVQAENAALRLELLDAYAKLQAARDAEAVLQARGHQGE